VGPEDDNMVNNLGMETYMSMGSKTSSRSAFSKVIELQACLVCGWSNVTMVRGLRERGFKGKLNA